MRLIKQMTALAIVLTLWTMCFSAEGFGMDERQLRLNPPEDNIILIANENADENSNITLKKPCTASSQTMDPAKAVDGDPNTRWSSRWQNGAAGATYAWLTVDLGGYYNISGGKIQWEDAYAKEYKIQVSDDNENFEDICVITNGKKGITALDMVGAGRYVRVECTKNGTAWGFSIIEFEVYGQPGDPYGEAEPLLRFDLSKGEEEGSVVIMSEADEAMPVRLLTQHFLKSDEPNVFETEEITLEPGETVLQDKLRLTENDSCVKLVVTAYDSWTPFSSVLTMGEPPQAEAIAADKALERCSYGVGEESITVRLEVGKNWASRMAAAAILKDGQPAAYEVCELDVNGAAELSFPIYMSTGDYKLQISVQGLPKMLETRFYYLNQILIKKALWALYEAKDTEELRTALSDEHYLDYLNIGDCRDYYMTLAGVTATQKIFDFLQANPNMTEEMIERDFRDCIMNSSLLDGLSAESAEEVKKNLALYEKEWKERFDFGKLSCYSYYLGREENTQLTICKRLSGKALTMENATEIFEKAVMLGGIEGAVSWNDIDELMNTYTEFFGNASSFSGVKIRSLVYSPMIGVNYENAAQAKNAEQNFIKAARESSMGGNGGSGGNGGTKRSGAAKAGAGGIAVLPETESTQYLDKGKVVTNYSDMEGHSWAKMAVQVLTEENIVHGVSKDCFCPERSVTRAEIIKLLTGAFGIYDENAKSRFSDVEPNSWQSAGIGSAEAYGLVMGIGDGTVGADNEILREEMAQLCMRFLTAFGYEPQKIDQGEEEEIPFGDFEETAEYARAAVLAMEKAGILNGDGTGLFHPKDSCTRAEAAMVVYRLFIIQKEAN